MESIGTFEKEALDKLKAWLSTVALSNAVHSSYAPNRRECWFRYGSNLQNPETTGEIFAANEPPQEIIEIGDSIYPGWHSLLVCGGDTSINWHRDHGHFEAAAVMINIGRSIFREDTGNDAKAYQLFDGDIVRIDTKILHSAEPLSTDRMNLTFRKIKEKYLPVQEMPLFRI